MENKLLYNLCGLVHVTFYSYFFYNMSVIKVCILANFLSFILSAGRKSNSDFYYYYFFIPSIPDIYGIQTI